MPEPNTLATIKDFSKGAPGGGLAGRVAVESGRRRVQDKSMAGNPPDPHELSFWLSPRLAVSSFRFVGPLMRPLPA
eukprot:1137148-Pelagomonas_calceolata.AAC.6